MGEKIPRLLRADEIECRVGVIYEHGLSLLLYTDARTIQKILDETYGTLGWQRSHEMIGNSMYCTISVWDADKKQWISKQDVGTESNSEKEKGEASDGLKRAAVNFGISRELYSSEFLWIPSSKVDIGRKNDRWVTNERFYVSDVQYDEERNISYLRIVNVSNQVVYEWKKIDEPKRNEAKFVSQEQMEMLRKELQRTGVTMAAVLGRYCIESERQISEDIYRKAMNDLKRTKSLRRVA